MVAALYVDRRGPYWSHPAVDPWDEKRDAREYAGPWPVIAHPPCARWSKLATVVRAKHGHEIGDDGGSFAAALDAVRRFGGVLEHPAYSYAWATFGLPRPRSGSWQRSLFDEGWVTEVSQCAYGHVAQKLTWLYYAGTDPKPLDWSRPRATAKVENMSSTGSSGRTPVEFAEALLRLVT